MGPRPSRARSVEYAFTNVLPIGTPLYIQDSGQVWETSIGTTEWTELDVPKSAELTLNANRLHFEVCFGVALPPPQPILDWRWGTMQQDMEHMAE